MPEITDEMIAQRLAKLGFDGYTVDEGRLMLLELLSKAGAGFYNSHTEEMYLMSFLLTKKNREPNKRGLKFIHSMVYASSNRKSKAFLAMQKYRV